jgi:hypothetical protein
LTIQIIIKGATGSIQIPRRIKLLLHSLMRKGLKTPRLIAAGVAVGAAVTLLETVCTGQVYLPTMTLVIKEGGS